MFTFLDLMGGADLSGVRAACRTVINTTIRLDAYIDAALPDDFLTSLTAALDSVRQAHLKVLLRFAYNSPGQPPNAANTRDASLSQIQTHLTQLKPILAQSSDVIVALEAGLIGQYGEWHDSSSQLTNPNDRQQVLVALLDAVPDNRTVLVRTPAFKRKSFAGPLTPGQAFGALAVARIGHHNDCFLASFNDLGTYLAPDYAVYLATDTAYLPMAGETCAQNPPRTDCVAALAEMQAMHWHLLNGDFEPHVLARWRDQGCFVPIAEQLGYQLALTDVQMTLRAVRPAPVLSLRAQISNTGFGRLFNPRPVYLSLVSAADGVRRDYLLGGVDPRLWGPGTTSTLSAVVPIDTLPQGTYTVALWLPDAAPQLSPIADYAVQMANHNTWDAAQGFNMLSHAFVVE